MNEVLPGVHHWSAKHPRIGIEVSSYYLDSGVAIDPLLGDTPLEWFAQRPAEPQVVLLSNRHHYRDAGELVERFGCRVLCNEAGLHEFEGTDREVEGFRPGDELPGDALAVEVGGICPDDTALYLRDQRAMVFADGIVRGGPQGQTGPLGFVPDQLFDDPERDKAALLKAFRRILDTCDFDHILLPHGGPVIGDGRAQLEDFVAEGGRPAFEMPEGYEG